MNTVKHTSLDVNVCIDSEGKPLCPICGKVMGLSSNRKGETLWECTNYDYGKDGLLVCPLIEARLDKYTKKMWGIHFEARVDGYPTP